MTAQVKICGINDPEAFDTAIAAGADWVGFNFFPPSPRFVTPARAAELSARSPGGPARVGLFVDPAPETIAATLDTVRLDILQLYGTPDIPALRARFGLPIWRAVGVATAADLPSSAGGADRLLVEAKPPPGATRPGGNAVRFDWALLRGWCAPAPWILAGGLTVDNVAEAIRVTGTSAVDVSSGVERTQGVKDPALIRAFIANAHSNGVRFRPATGADADALGHVHVAAWREAYVGLIPDEVLAALDPRARAAMWRDVLAKGGAVHLAERHGGIIGFASGGPQRDASLPYSGEVRAIYVLRFAQRQGVGRALMSAVARELLMRGRASATLWVLEGNSSARRFYEALGGRAVGRRETQSDGFSAVDIAYGWQDLGALTGDSL
jgi:phosphoribosylanthranilate isomerase